MRRKIGFGPTANRRNKNVPRAMWALLLIITLFGPWLALAADEECDTTVGPFASPADNLCVPAIELNAPMNVDAFDTEWTAGTFFDHGFHGVMKQARARVSRRATGIDKSDLLLFFEIMGDSVATGLDEIRIGVNPGTTAANSTLFKIHAFPTAGPPPTKERFTFNTATSTWSAPTAGEAFYQVATRAVPATSSWFAEVRIPLNLIPAHPITGADLRLYLEVIADDGVSAVTIQWPNHENFAGLHDFACANPDRWHPMSFGTNCPNPDLNIAGGLYSCDAVYISRAGAKSTEIGVDEVNHFHADVTNPSTQSAPNSQVYLTLLSLGTSTTPLAMNYNNTDAAITSFFTDKYGGWMTATDHLDHATPAPPVAITIAPGLNTAERMQWKPADETRFGPKTGFAGHRCTAAFVNFKDDPNFANNFSYCNTSIVNCPAGEICVMGFGAGQVFPNHTPQENLKARLVVSVINEPFPGWLQQGKFTIGGERIQQLKDRMFEVTLPAKGEVPLKISFAPPRRGDVLPKDSPTVSPQASPRASPQGTRNPNNDIGATTAPNRGAEVAQAKPGEKGSDPVKERDERLRKIYGDRPMIVVEQFVPAGFETGLDGQSKVPLFSSTSYVAFIIDPNAAALASPTPPPNKGVCACGRASGQSLALSSLIALFGIAFTWRRARRRNKK